MSPTPIPTIKAAAVHAAPVYMDKAASSAKVVDLIRQASSQGISLLGFPETFIPGYPYFIECYAPLRQVNALVEYAKQSISMDGPELASIASACQQYRVAIVLGFSERAPGGHTLFNSQAFIDSTGILCGIHRKLQPTYVERTVWAQGSGYTLRAFDMLNGWRVSGLACWEHTMNGARQALIQDGQQIHVGSWPALSTMNGFEQVADAQIEAMMKTHALTAQTYVITSSNYVDEECLRWMEANLGPQDMVKLGGGWSSVLHPFCFFMGDGPAIGGATDKFVIAELDVEGLAPVKVWVDAAGHYARPEILHFRVNRTPYWPFDEASVHRHGKDEKRHGKVDEEHKEQLLMPSEQENCLPKQNGIVKHSNT